MKAKIEPRTAAEVDPTIRDRALDEVEAAFSLMARKAGLPRLHERMTAAVGIPLEHASFQLVRRLGESGPLRASELAVLMGLDLSTVSRQVASLEVAGLVERRPDPVDRRASLLTLSEEGRVASSRICAARRAMFAEMLTVWPEEDVERFAELIGRFAHAMATLAEHHPTHRETRESATAKEPV
jgi:DNA-binding MarR family transcriptional regulator